MLESVYSEVVRVSSAMYQSVRSTKLNMKVRSWDDLDAW